MYYLLLPNKNLSLKNKNRLLVPLKDLRWKRTHSHQEVPRRKWCLSRRTRCVAPPGAATSSGSCTPKYAASCRQRYTYA